MKKDDPFAWRSGGFKFEIGSGEEQGVSAFIEVDGKFLCLTNKSIHSIIMADVTDPNKTNPNIGHSQQKILPYGSDNHIVGRTLQQASILFIEHSLSPNVDISKGVSIGFSFLNEMVSLDRIKDEYISKEQDQKNNFTGKPATDGSTHIPTITNLKQQVENFVTTADHATKSLIELVQLFYPDIKNKGWEEQLYIKLKDQYGEKDERVIFVGSFKESTEMIRKIRNTIEHPDTENIISIKNYELTPKGAIKKPEISFNGKNYRDEIISFPETLVSDFMIYTLENLLIIFELLMAYLCDIHAQPFAGDKRVVAEVLPEKRLPNEKKVRFKYDILWTK